jgi:hypothetical protein
MSTQTTVRLNSDVVGEVRTYSRLTGMPINRVIEDAVERYLEVVGMVRLAGMIDEVKKRSSGWLSEAERELLNRQDASGAIHLHDEAPEAVFNENGVGGRSLASGAPFNDDDVIAG